MKILVSNDDGVYAIGIGILAAALKKIADVTVVAPDRNRSGASNSLTLNAPMHAKEIASGIISVEGTPTDSVHLALTGLLEELPDMVVSGINEGGNLGDDILYSGTVAAAIEGRSLGLPAIAISLVGHDHYETAAAVMLTLVERLIADPLPANTILNVNVPNVPQSELEGYSVTRLGSRHRAEPTIIQRDPRGRKIYWVGPAGDAEDAGIGTDFHAIERNRVSITPLQIDFTHYDAFEQLSKWVTDL